MSQIALFFLEPFPVPRIRPVTEEKDDSRNEAKLCYDGPNSVAQHEVPVARKVSLALQEPDQENEEGEEGEHQNKVQCEVHISSAVFHKEQD